MSVPTTTAHRLIELACHAPSVHNTQPWLWAVEGDEVLLHADRRRQLPAEDPDGRSLTISCGAALHHFQFAANALGWATDTTVTPRPEEPDLLAVVRLRRGEPSLQPVDDLAALRRRCTDRRRFTSWPVHPAALDRLADEARNRGAHAAPVVDAVARFRLELLNSDATAVDGGDGVIVLGGTTDDRTGWMRTGEGLSALWLRATRDGLSVVPLSLPVDVDSIRMQLTATVLDGAFVPHLAVRIGWQAIGRTGLKRTPRRPVDDVLLHRTGGTKVPPGPAPRPCPQPRRQTRLIAETEIEQGARKASDRRQS